MARTRRQAEPNREALRTQLSRLRAQRGLTYEQLAELTGLSWTAVINLELGRTHGSLDTWHRVAHAVGVPLGNWSTICAPGTGARTSERPGQLRDQPVIATGQLPSAVTRPWNDTLHSLGNAEAVARMLGISHGALDERVRRGAVVSVRRRDGQRMFPLIQFVHGTVHPAVAETATQLASRGLDEWTVLSWFAAPHAGLGWKTPAQWLVAGGDMHPVKLLADDFAARRRPQLERLLDE